MNRKITPIKTVIIGCGNITGLNEEDFRRIKPATHIGAIKKNPNFKLCGVYDLDNSKSKYFEKKFNVKSYYNLNDLLNSTKAELVVVAVPYKNTLNVFNNFLKFKSNIKYIFCEKPISSSLNSALKIANLCKNKKIKLFINNRRLDSGIKKLKNIISSNKLGKLNYIEGRCSSGLYALGIHLIDTIKYISNHEFNFKYKTHDKYKKKKLNYSKNYLYNDPKTISVSLFKNVYCTIINSVRSSFSYFEIYLRFANGKVYYDQSKNFIEYEFLSKKKKKSSIDFLIDKRKKIYFRANSIFKENYKYLAKNLNKKNNLLGHQHAIKNMKVIETLKINGQ